MSDDKTKQWNLALPHVNSNELATLNVGHPCLVCHEGWMTSVEAVFGFFLFFLK